MTSSPDSLREGEQTFAADALAAGDAHLVFIGRIRSPWTIRSDCPRNLRQARVRNGSARVEIALGVRLALTGPRAGQWIVLLFWLDRARRDLALQAPQHASEPRGTFLLRSPVRPNPVGLHLVRIVAPDMEAGAIRIDVLDETPLLDVKPFIEVVDVPPGRATDAR